MKGVHHLIKGGAQGPEAMREQIVNQNREAMKERMSKLI